MQEYLIVELFFPEMISGNILETRLWLNDMFAYDCDGYFQVCWSTIQVTQFLLVIALESIGEEPNEN